ncbi:hypothetical protein Brms1b_013459, partial [Colletotrichum noveboracense]
SFDVLKIEKHGPDEDLLTIIDVPGIFRNTTEGVTTNRDKELVKSMVKRYIKDSRTIILAVLPSNVDVATQEILTLAEEADPAGDRTLGILTKADLLKEKTAKAAVVSLVEGNRKPLKLGYHIVANRGGDEVGDEDDPVAALRQREAMFDENPWDDLSEGRVGVQALRERLADLLGEITDRAFPELRTEIRQKLSGAEKKLEGLGASRQTEREQQQYLVSIMSDFQALVRAALEADYSAHQAFARDDLRLITTVVNLTDKFNSDFGDFGCTYMFEWQLDISNLFAATVAQPPTSGFATDGEGEENSDDGSNATELTSCDIPDPTMYPDLEGIIVTDWHIEPPKQGIMKWIETVHHRSRGLDLGSVTPRILSSVFREQSAKWELISRQYLSKVILLLHRFILSALQVVCADSQVVQNILSMTIGDICAKYEASMAQVELLAGVERQQRPYTLNVSFNENQQKSQGVRIKNTLLPKARRENGKSLSPRIINLSDVPEAFTNKSNAAYARETVHDSLEAYYKVAYRRFVDNVFSQAVDYKLLSGPDTPLRLLSDGWVLKLNTEELQFIAGESRWTRERRKKLTKEIDDLEVAMKILR